MRRVVLVTVLGVCVALISVACGLTVKGEGAEPTDGGSDGLASKADTNSTSALPFCAQQRANDSTVKRCLDFDDATSNVPPTFGFEILTSKTEDPSSFTDLATSPVTTGAKSLRIGFDTTGGASRQVAGYFPALEGNGFASKPRVTFDVDVSVDKLSIDYAAIAELQLIGDPPCTSIDIGFAVNPDSVVRVDQPATVLAPLTLGGTMHLRGVVSLSDSKSELFINGTSVASSPIITIGCTFIKMRVGAFYTSLNPGVVDSRFDQLVLRTE